MKPQKNVKRQDNTEKRNKAIVIFIALVIISSTFAVVFYGFSPGTSRLEYNGFSLAKKNDFWTASINKKEASFGYFPTDVEDINISSDVTGRIRNTLEVDATSDINSTYKESIAFAQYNLAQTLNYHFNIYLRQGFTSQNEYNAPVILCKNSTKSVPVVYFRNSNQTRVFIENDCIIIEFRNDYDLIRSKDRILYGLFGIIR